jgi:hypothetical protein
MRYLRYLVFAALCLCAPAGAQMMMMNVENGAGSSYMGPGDVVSGATVWWGLRAYNGAWATAHNKIACISLPATGTCLDVSSDSNGNFNLAAVGGLSTCNNSTVLCTIKTLYDQSGASSCSGPCDVTNSTQANQPVLVVPGTSNGCTTTSNFCISTQTGSQVLVAIAGLASAVNQAFSTAVVYINPSRSGDEYILESNFTVPVIASGFGGANMIGCGAGTTVAVTATDNVYHAVSCIFNGSSSSITVDGSTTSSLSMGTNTTFTATFDVLNQSSSGSTGLTGFSTELGLWPAGFTGPNLTSLNTNMHGYWGF